MHIILIHGLGGSPRSKSIQYFARYLRGRGYTVSCPALPGHSESDIARAGEFTYTLGAKKIKHYILTKIKKERCVIVGISGGGIVGSRALREIYDEGKGKNISGLMLINTPAYYHGESLRKKYRIMILCQRIFGGIPYFFSGKKKAFGLAWLRDFYYDALNFDAVDDVSHIKCPVHILGSTIDKVIPADHQIAWSSLAESMGMTYRDIRCNHLCIGAEGIVKSEIATFLKTL